jgi:hypothetical protein
MSEKKESKAGRRDFLRGTATGTLLAAAAIAVGGPRKAWAKPETKEERKKARYQESAHVKRFYETNRY